MSVTISQLTYVFKKSYAELYGIDTKYVHLSRLSERQPGLFEFTSETIVSSLNKVYKNLTNKVVEIKSLADGVVNTYLETYIKDALFDLLGGVKVQLYVKDDGSVGLSLSEPLSDSIKRNNKVTIPDYIFKDTTPPEINFKSIIW